MDQSKLTKVSLIQFLNGLIAGTKANSSNTAIVLGGRSFTSQSIVDTLQGLVDALAKVDVAHSQWKDTLTQLAQAKAAVGPVAGLYQTFLLTIYGSSPSTLGGYGLSPKKQKAPLTTEQRAAATAKAKATRAARHTLGSKQKLTVMGNVTGVVVTPVTAPPPAAKPTS